jgi:hypothetical protein
MPLQLIKHGIPIAIIAFMALQRSVIISIEPPSIGVILQTMPSFVISKVIRHIIGMAIIGIMPPIIPGIIPPIIPGIMPPIIPGIMPGIIPPIGTGIGIIIGPIIEGMPPA